jgi:hypothetical protein
MNTTRQVRCRVPKKLREVVYDGLVMCSINEKTQGKDDRENVN